MGFVVQDLIPPDKIEQFQEFKACELYHGIGAFKDIDERPRFDAIQALLVTVKNFKLPIIYSAVDKKKLAKMAIGGANPVDVAFRMCARGINQWMSLNDENGLGLFIMDETDDKPLKGALIKSFQIMRSNLRPPYLHAELWHIHDDMYFGDSRYSMGLQLADLCAYFIGRRLRFRGDEVFFSHIASQLICSKVEPDWSQLKDVFLDHAALPEAERQDANAHK